MTWEKCRECGERYLRKGFIFKCAKCCLKYNITLLDEDDD